MPANSDSQCYFAQRQIDSYLDGQLSQAQQETFMYHVQGCQDCARELQYAQIMHDAVLDMPLVDCEEQVLEPVYRLAQGGGKTGATDSFWTQVGDLFRGVPAFARYGMAAAAVALVAVATFPVLFNREQPAPLVAEQATTEPVEEYAAEDIQQALEDLNLAIDYLNQVSQRTEVMIGDRFLVTPLQDSFNASFERARIRRQDQLQDDPI